MLKKSPVKSTSANTPATFSSQRAGFHSSMNLFIPATTTSPSIWAWLRSRGLNKIRPCPSGWASSAALKKARRNAADLGSVNGSALTLSASRSHSTCGNNSRQRSTGLRVNTSPVASSFRYFDGIVSRPLASSVCVYSPRNISVALLSAKTALRKNCCLVRSFFVFCCLGSLQKTLLPGSQPGP